MIIPSLKAPLHSPDVSDLELYTPQPDCFGFLLEAEFGPSNSNGAELFDFMVCTPSWLALHMKEDEVRSARHYIIVKKYDFNALKSYLLNYAASCAAPTWNEVALKLSRIGRWEFEDYVPHKSD